MSDVCLILEGTYPYVRGGVSSWVHKMVTQMPDIKFSILSIMPSPRDTKEVKFNLPDNIQSIINVYLHDYNFRPKFFKKRTPNLFKYFEMYFRGIDEVSKEQIELFLLELIKERHSLDLVFAFSSKTFWKAVRKMYDMGDTTISFLDFFWNYRFTFLPLVQLLKANIPPSPLYHTISTGYAGVMAVLAKIKFNSNMMLTEHGIYTKERRIEIAQATWIYEKKTEFVKATPELGFFKDWWMRYFEVMSKLTYKYADQITTLYDGNKTSQIKDGADPNKISIIPNGVDISTYTKIAQKREKKSKRRSLAFVGRIVPIKDVKILIKACKIIAQELPDVQVLLIGPQEEESQYYQECSILIKTLGLEKNLIFTGHVDLKDYYPAIDVIMLTSISEAQPLVLLEAMACGVPSVATDVGSCRELLEGTTEEDKMLGPSGLITRFHSPEETAEAALKLLTNDDLYYSMSAAGIERTKTYYNQSDMVVAYKNLYEQYI
jgi:glycosyltransferase involved in cell wall biosynthesis